MAAFSGVPVWVETSKRKVQRSEEWLAFSKELFDAVSVPMRELGVRTFGALSPEEQKVLIIEAVESIKIKPAYRDLLSVVSQTLDEEICATASREVDQKDQQLSKIDLVAKQCHEAIDVILSKRPDTKIHIRQCFGAVLGSKLRYTVWNAQLHNSQVKDEYKYLVTSGQKKRLVSQFDLEISQKCQSMLKSDSTLTALLSIRAAPSIMRHLLSFHHARSKSQSSLTDTEYLLAIPFVYCTLSAFVEERDPTRQTQNLTTEVLASLVGQYELFICDRPDYMTAPSPGPKFSKFSAIVTSILNNTDHTLVARLDHLLSKSVNISEQGESLNRLFHPVMRSFMVGYLPLDTVMFIWDHFVIGYGVENFDPLPSLSACLLLILRNKLLECSTWREVGVTLKEGLRTLTPEQLRGAMLEWKFTEKLRNLLEEDRKQKRKYPLVQPSVLQSLPPWRDWYSVKLASHFQNARKKPPDVSRTVVFKAEDDSDTEVIDAEEIEDLKSEKDTLIDELQLMREELENARKLLAEEQIAKSDLQERADDEIERLRRRLAYAEHPEAVVTQVHPAKLGLSTPQYSDSDASRRTTPGERPESDPRRTTPARVVTPSPVPQDSAELPVAETPVQEEDVAPDDFVNQSKGEEEALQVMEDLAGRMMGGAKLILHGTDDEQKQLNAQTESDMRQIRKAYEQAKVDVLGRPVSDEEMANLPEKDRQKVERTLSEATKKRLMQLKFV